MRMGRIDQPRVQAVRLAEGVEVKRSRRARRQKRETTKEGFMMAVELSRYEVIAASNVGSKRR